MRPREHVNKKRRSTSLEDRHATCDKPHFCNVRGAVCVWCARGSVCMVCVGQCVYGVRGAVCVWCAWGSVCMGCVGQCVYGVRGAVCVWGAWGRVYGDMRQTSFL